MPTNRNRQTRIQRELRHLGGHGLERASSLPDVVVRLNAHHQVGLVPTQHVDEMHNIPEPQ